MRFFNRLVVITGVGVGFFVESAATTSATLAQLEQELVVLRNIYDRMAHDLKLGKKSESRYRISLVEDLLQGKDYNPLSPYKISSQTTTISWDYFPDGRWSFGLSPSQNSYHIKSQLFPVSSQTRNVSITPFVGCLFAPQWLGSMSGSMGYSEQKSFWTQDRNLLFIRQQSYSYSGAVFLTWIGPQTPLSASIQGGVGYSMTYNKGAIDIWGDRSKSPNFQRGYASLSMRIKYSPGESWEIYGQVGGSYAAKVTRRLGDYRSCTGRQRERLVAGSGVYYHASQGFDILLAYLHTAGYGFYRDDQLTLSVRVLW